MNCLLCCLNGCWYALDLLNVLVICRIFKILESSLLVSETKLSSACDQRDLATFDATFQ
jgi:hypothetical protein